MPERQREAIARENEGEREIEFSTRELLSIKWQEKIPVTEVFTRAGLPSVYTTVMKSQFRWAGHIARMPDHRLSKKLLFGELRSVSVEV